MSGCMGVLAKASPAAARGPTGGATVPRCMAVLWRSLRRLPRPAWRRGNAVVGYAGLVRDFFRSCRLGGRCGARWPCLGVHGVDSEIRESCGLRRGAGRGWCGFFCVGSRRVGSRFSFLAVCAWRMAVRARGDRLPPWGERGRLGAGLGAALGLASAAASVAAARRNGRLRLGAGAGCRRGGCQGGWGVGWLGGVGGQHGLEPGGQGRRVKLGCGVGAQAVRRTQGATRAEDRTPHRSVARRRSEDRLTG